MENLTLQVLPESWGYRQLESFTPADREITYGVVKPGKDVEEGVKFIRAGDLREGQIQTSDLKHIDPEIEGKYRRSRLLGGEVLLTIVGRVGETAVVPDSLKGANIARAVALIPVESKLDAQWIHLALQTRQLQRFIRDWCNTTVQPTLNLEDVKQLPIPYAPDRVREKAVSVLGALDDKIELNRRMNRTLEEMAQTLYRHWFVDFGPFQDREFKDTEELGPIPEGWEVKSIGDVVKMKGGSTPKTSMDEYWDGGDITWFTPTDLTSANRMYLSESDRQITEEGLNSCSTNYIPPYSLMMTSRATVGVVAFNRTRACTNQGFINLMPQEQVSRFQIYFWIQQMMPEIMARADGSTYPEISQRDFKPLPIPVAPAEDIEEYVGRSIELFDLIENNILESDTLAETRDYLLPKLISGEIEVDAAVEAAEEVAGTTV